MPRVDGPGFGGDGGGGGLHFRSPVDVFATNAARTTAFSAGGSVAGEHVQFAADRSLAIAIGTLANPTAFQTYTGDSSAYDDTAWLPRTDAVQGLPGSTAALSDDDPEPTGTAAPGTGTTASRHDHVHESTGGSGGLNTAQVRALIADPAEQGNTDTWPAAKLPAATATERGAVELSTPAEVVAGTDAERAATAEGVQAVRDLLAELAGAIFTGAVEISSPSGGPLMVDGQNAGNSTIMKIFTPDTGTQKAFGAGREGEFDWVQFAGEIVAGKPGFALGPGTARDTNLYREEANVLKTDDAFVAEGTVTGATPTVDEHLTTKAYVDSAIAALSPAQTHLNYIAISENNAFTAAEFTDSGTGGNSMSPSLVVPTFSGVSRFIAIAVPDAQDDITDILQGGVSTFGAWVRIAGTLTIGGEAHKVWRTVDTQNDLASGLTYVIAQ